MSHAIIGLPWMVRAAESSAIKSAIVKIESKGRIGTGFIIAKYPDIKVFYIITATHVVDVS